MRLDVAPGEVVALLGPSGTGKSTLLHIAAGLDPDFRGSVALSPGARLGYVFQAPRLLPWRTVRDNVALALPPALRRGDRPERLLAAVGLAEAAGKYPSELSGGMQRRAALARAFALDADVLLLDEPFVSLDAASAALLRRGLAEHARERGRSLLLVTHDPREALEVADRILVMGGSPATVLRELRVPPARPGRTEEEIDALLRAHRHAIAPTPQGNR